MLFIPLVACEATPVVDDKNPADTGDTGVEDIDDTDDTSGDTAGDTSGDTGDDTGDDPEETLTWNVTGRTDDSAFSLVHLQFPETDGGDITMGAVWLEAEAGATISLPAEEPPDDFFQLAGGGLSIAAFVGALHEDDGDTRWEASEGWVAASTHWAVYVDGVVPPELLALGVVSGWNALRFEGESFVVGDPGAMPIEVALTESLLIGGTYDHTLNHDDRVIVLPATAFGGLPVASYLDDQALAADGTWSVSLEGEPPLDHYADIDNDGVQEAVEVPVAYVDNDGSLAYSSGDTVLAAACVGDKPVGGWWLGPPTDVVTLVGLQAQGLSLGWVPVALADEGGVLSVDEVAAAVLSTDCGLGE